MPDQLALFTASASTLRDKAESVPALVDLLIDLKRKVPPGTNVRVHPDNRNNHIPNDQYNTWDACIVAGRDYLVGNSMDLKEFLRKHTSALNDWQQAAYLIAWYFPDVQVIVETGHNGPRHYDWAIYCRGEYVNFSLPHQDAGGERDYISRDGRKRVLINVD